ncbi:MAG TPA: PLP-dependent transferase, partial [Geminicoccaceae bacterium]|nr:PLP-dependent transferase [Geminicoccaceae bacterium]
MMELRPETLLAQAAGADDPTTGGIIPPVQPSTTFLRDADNAYRRGFDYARDRNPTYAPAEAVLAALEGGAEALLFSSGMAAATAVFQALRPGDHVVAPRVIYWGLRRWLLQTATAWGLEVELVDTTEPEAVRAALRPGRTRLLWLETPANPTWEVSDIAALSGLAREAGALVAVDNTVPTPLLTRPLELGADLVMHSATKYLNGHSDVVAGALVTGRADEELWSRVRAIRHDQGAILGPFEAWLLTRGLRTLHLRVRASCGN